MFYCKSVSNRKMVYFKKFGAHPKRVGRNPNSDSKVMAKF
jgi:hypothetical protein